MRVTGGNGNTRTQSKRTHTRDGRQSSSPGRGRHRTRPRSAPSPGAAVCWVMATVDRQTPPPPHHDNPRKAASRRASNGNQHGTRDATRGSGPTGDGSWRTRDRPRAGPGTRIHSKSTTKLRVVAGL
eukprot:gene20251-biopygen2558